MTKKYFDDWMGRKESIHNSNRIPAIKEGEIWWSAVGENVGIEINGKHALFSRPVLIFKKFSRLGFMSIPLTSQPHTGSWYVSFQMQDKLQTAVLSQARTLSVNRLYKRIGRIDETDMKKIKERFHALYCK